MENQHRKISGYRELSEEEIALMNEAKQMEKQCLALIRKIEKVPDVDLRAVALGKTNIQQGFMWAIRGVARPE